MARLIYLTHPQVVVDPSTPVPEWDLSDLGRARVAGLNRPPWLQSVTRIVASAEVKAQTTAALLARQAVLSHETRPDMGENDRSATGYLPEPQFEALADGFFANPGLRVQGWESARAAQERIVAAVGDLAAQHHAGDLLCVGHGAVGTLLMCHCAGWEISRAHDQPAGGGNLFVAALPRLTLVHGWRRLEDGPA